MPVDSKVDCTNRNRLLQLCMDRGISQEIMIKIIAPMEGHSQDEKERIAAELISVVESGVFDCSPRHFYHKTEWYRQLNQLLDMDCYCYDSLRPIVEEILRFCNVSGVEITNIMSILRTVDALRQMYNWLMDEHYVPSEIDCIAKAAEICSSL
ncbi:MAG: hypothetical protein IKU58_07975 [Clostridia bacterium]|nr:hypothetical protein [Clostridia bacterium]